MSLRMIVMQDCFCEHYLHEKTNYPRPWLKELKLKAGDEVDFIEAWGNFYGYYYRVQKDDQIYDIKPEYLKDLPRDMDEDDEDFQGWSDMDVPKDPE